MVEQEQHTRAGKSGAPQVNVRPLAEEIDVGAVCENATERGPERELRLEHQQKEMQGQHELEGNISTKGGMGKETRQLRAHNNKGRTHIVMRMIFLLNTVYSSIHSARMNKPLTRGVAIIKVVNNTTDKHSRAPTYAKQRERQHEGVEAPQQQRRHHSPSA